MDIAEARRTARAELADDAAARARAAAHTAAENARDREGAADARRMEAAHWAMASMLDPAAYPPPARAPRTAPGTVELVTPEGVGFDELTGKASA